MTVKFKMSINSTVSVVPTRPASNDDEEFDDENNAAVEQKLDGKFFVIAPKLIEMSMFKIFKEDDEMFLEEMLVQTLVNSQIENLRSLLAPLKLSLKNFNHRPEMECLGFHLHDTDINFRKNYIHIKSYF